MKIAICVTGEHSSAVISPEFTGANYFLIIDTRDKSLPQRIENRYYRLSAAEIFCPWLLLSKGIDKVICGKCAPDAKRIFKEAKVEVIENVDGLIADHFPVSPETVLK